MFATPCILPVPNPPAALAASVPWQQRAAAWETRWNRARHSRDPLARVRFQMVYCQSAYAHMIAVALGGQ